MVDIVEMPAEETGALSPSQQAQAELTNEETRTQNTDGDFTIPSEGNSEGTNEEAVGEAEERPEWMPEKFDSPEEFAKAYKELEAKLGEGAVEELPTELSADSLDKYSERYAENGKLEDEDYSELEKMGLPRSIVDSYIQGNEAALQVAQNTVFGEVGGQDNYQEMVTWASTNLDTDEIALYDEAMNSGDMTKVMNAVRGLNARHSNSEGRTPTLVKGKSKGNNTSGYASLEEMKVDMRNPKYHADPAFREQVQRKLSVSNII